MSSRNDRRSALKIGKPSPIRLNMMVVGETGSGKTTFLKTLFKLYCGNKIIRSELSSKTTTTVMIEKIGSFTLGTDALDCEIHLFDSPGYGDCIDNSDAIMNVKNHLEQAHQSWLQTPGNEMTEKARNAADGRIHCVFYFIAPHRIKTIDKAFLKQLAGLAPIVMVVAKADTMTWLERKDHLIAVRKLVEELEKECKMPIAFDFLEEDAGFIDCTNAPKSGDNNCAKGDDLFTAEAESTMSARDFLDLSPCLVESEFGGDGPALMYEARFTYHGKPYQPDVDAQPVHYPARLDSDGGEPPSDTCDEETSESLSMDLPAPARLFAISQPSSPRELLERSVHQPLPKIRNAFAVVCDTSESGKREFPWGSVDIYNEAHSDFRRLQRLVFESDHIVRMRELTQEMSMALNKPRSLLDHLRVVKSIKPAVERVSKTVHIVAQAVNAFILFVAWVVVPMLLVYYVYFSGSLGAINLFSETAATVTASAIEDPTQASPEVLSAFKTVITDTLAQSNNNHNVHIEEHFSRCNAYTGYFGCGEVHP